MSAGLHYASDLQISQSEAIFAHFKYHAKFLEKARAEAARQQHFNGAEEYQKYLALVSEGRDILYDPEISVHWTECAFVQQRLKV